MSAKLNFNTRGIIDTKGSSVMVNPPLLQPELPMCAHLRTNFQNMQNKDELALEENTKFYN
jgi:hypothetical protein